MTDIIERLKEPEAHYPGNFDTPKRANAMLSCLCQEAAEEIERLRGALADIINPIGAMRRDLEDGYELNGAMAVAMANDPEHYKRIARDALTANAK